MSLCVSAREAAFPGESQSVCNAVREKTSLRLPSAPLPPAHRPSRIAVRISADRQKLRRSLLFVISHPPAFPPSTGYISCLSAHPRRSEAFSPYDHRITFPSTRSPSPVGASRQKAPPGLSGSILWTDHSRWEHRSWSLPSAFPANR